MSSGKRKCVRVNAYVGVLGSRSTSRWSSWGVGRLVGRLPRTPTYAFTRTHVNSMFVKKGIGLGLTCDATAE